MSDDDERSRRRSEQELADAEPKVTPAPKSPREFKVAVDRQFGRRRRRTMIMDLYFHAPRVRAWLGTSVLITAIGIAATAILGLLWAAVVAVGLLLLVLLLVISPLQLLRRLPPIDDGSDSPSATFAAQYGKKSFRILLPSGAINAFLYSELSEVHQRGDFIIFDDRRTRRRNFLPIGVVPKQDVGWLRARVLESSDHLT